MWMGDWVRAVSCGRGRGQVHCQGGKGRSGTFCSSLMLWYEFADTADRALDLFAARRTDLRIDKRATQGVAAPCQIRCFPPAITH